MKTRAITGFLLAIFFIPIFYFGGIILNATLISLTGIATFEIFRMFNVKAKLSKYTLGIVLLISGMVYFLVYSYFLNSNGVELLLLLFVLLVTIRAMLLLFSAKFDVHTYIDMFVSVLYPSIGFAAIYGLRLLDIHNIGFMFMITIMTDLFAYLVGIRYGKHRLAINISPKKSIEGSIGGTFFAVLFTLGYIYIFNITYIGEIQLNIFISILLIIFISIFGQLGDLVASKLKRSFGIKDYSNLFPGHGGVMDRFDSALLAAMVLMIISGVVGLL